ncbi:cob(I)yrinic acid a,c-diamide adenosyltransferase, partial [Mesorhizobium sp. M2A.F.Ca.ET.067.02.1.1]|uniref:cob(I)yrinic acid a,c-diamide adenosyltransferase n=1 Tax=Mesorhizobium sp. M2A.F.Ca.ET.067.02.1.1 TaxID=2496749 RepID=UPI0032AFBB70
TWETQDLKRDIAAAEAAWAKALELMADPSISLVVLDELNIALRYDYLDLEKVVVALRRVGAICMSSSPAATPSRCSSRRPISSPKWG